MKKRSKALFFFLLFCILLGNLLLVKESTSPSLPKHQAPPKFYSNQCRDDLRLLILEALKQSKKSIFLVVFGLSEHSILSCLKEKAKEPLEMKVFYDKRFSSPFHLPNRKAFPLVQKGLMHQKILVIDDEEVFLGSANLTHGSLSMHDNLIIGFHSASIAKFLKEKAPFYSGHLQSEVGGQKIELFLLPDGKGKALNRLVELLQGAQKSLFIAMFTLTHPLLVEELIHAHKRGVKVEVFVDYQSGTGASSKAVECLKRAHIPTFLCRGLQLFHHKFALIDDQIFISGSTNWTRSAFLKNADDFFVLYDLIPEQKTFLQKLEGIIENEAS